MKLTDHVNLIRNLIEKSFDKRFASLGIGATKELEMEKIPSHLHAKREKLDSIIENHIGETGSYKEARIKVLDELTFTLFNRIASIKVMEALELIPPIITKDSMHGDRSFGHKAYLEENPDAKNLELEGLREYIKEAFNTLGDEFALYHKNHPYALLPQTIELGEIIDAFNAIEKDAHVEENIWQSDDILGWLYESYNTAKKLEFKESGGKTEYDKVSLQSQVYTPKWVVEFLVNNSLGKLYLEMYPQSEIKNSYKIANAPSEKTRDIKPLTELKLIDPACGSGNFLLYAFDLFYALYTDQIENYDAEYNKKDIAKLIIENNLHGIDLDDRAIQIAQLGLYIKAKKRRANLNVLSFSVVSSDFFLPPYSEVEPIFESSKLDSTQKRLVEEIWSDLQQAYKFGSLIKIGEKLKAKIEALDNAPLDLFTSATIQEHKEFEKTFFANLRTAVEQHAKDENQSFLSTKTADAIKYLEIITQKYDIATANPPYTPRAKYGVELQSFIDNNFREPYDTYINLYACFIQRNHELLNDAGKMSMITPMTFMFISTFKSTRELILSNYHISLFVHYGFGGVFAESVDPAFFILEKEKKVDEVSDFIKLDDYFAENKRDIFDNAFNDLLIGKSNIHTFSIIQSSLLEINSHPFLFWISQDFQKKFNNSTLEENVKVCVGLQTGDNNKFLRYWWEIDLKNRNDLQWIRYAKGGTFNKWAGNLWLTVNWNNSGVDIKNFKDENGKLRSRPQNESQYFQKGITYSASGRGGYAFRILPDGCIFDVGGSSIFPVKKYKNIEYLLALMNSKLVFYIANCLNPTANIQVGDLQRVPFVEPKKDIEQRITILSNKNIEYTKKLLSYSITEYEYKQSLFQEFKNNTSLLNALKRFIIEKLAIDSLILINEHLINIEIFKVYELDEQDIALVINNQGVDSSTFPASKVAIQAFCEKYHCHTESDLANHINDIHELDSPLNAKDIEQSFVKLFNSNKTLDSLSHEFKAHPIEIWYQYTQADILPQKYKKEKGLELLIEVIHNILNEDDDGIVPLVHNSGEKILLDRIEDEFHTKGFSSSEYASINKILEKDLGAYLENHFFKDFSDHLNMFSYLPKTPFIWHLSSGEYKGFECYISIYKWSRDNLLRLKSVYIENRERALQNRQLDLANDNSASAQNEKDLLFKQLREIEEYKTKIDDLLANGYNPALDSGVGKNIAPLQKAKMISYEVLNAGQLKKYLMAEW